MRHSLGEHQALLGRGAALLERCSHPPGSRAGAAQALQSSGSWKGCLSLVQGPAGFCSEHTQLREGEVPGLCITWPHSRWASATVLLPITCTSVWIFLGDPWEYCRDVGENDASSPKNQAQLQCLSQLRGNQALREHKTCCTHGRFGVFHFP